MRALLAVAAIGATLACGSPAPAVSPPAFGTVSGHVLSFPCAPVERVGESPCAGRPAAHVEIDFKLGTSAPVRGITDAAGAYAVQLAPGTYTVSLPAVRVTGGPHSVTVSGGATTTADFQTDSGIR